jgi:hypothetical protein
MLYLRQPCSTRAPRPRNFCCELSLLMLSALLYLGAAIALSMYRFLPGFESREAQFTRRDLPPIFGVIFFGGIAGADPRACPIVADAAPHRHSLRVRRHP